MRYYVIPNLKEKEKYIELSKKYNLGFEYNEFFIPDTLDDENKISDILCEYKKLNRTMDTLHGAFFDIVLDSMDQRIQKISFDRVKKSLEIADKLGCKGVIFHTNYITWMKDLKYRRRWIEYNKRAYLSLIEEFPNLEIYIENMFDLDPYLLKDLVQEIDHERIGVCLDFAHANISNTSLDTWFYELKPYIKHIHINDNDGTIDSHDEIGKGSIDFKKVFEYIHQLDDKTTILIEISDYNKAVASIEYCIDKGLIKI